MYRLYKKIPDIFTLGNLFCGCCAIVFFLQSGELFISVNGFEEKIIRLPPQIWWGCVFIAIAAVFDFLDGFLARVLKVDSELGKQLDSLSDMVSFGVVPSLILYILLRISFMQEVSGLDINWFVLSPAFLVACAAGYRLAKFNLDKKQTKHFIGMPTPAMTILVIGLPFLIWFDSPITTLLLNKWVLYGLIIVLCYLMNTKTYFFSFRITKGELRTNFLSLILLGVFILSLITFGFLSLFITWLAYIILSYLFQNRLQNS